MHISIKIRTYRSNLDKIQKVEKYDKNKQTSMKRSGNQSEQVACNMSQDIEFTIDLRMDDNVCI